MIAESCIAAAPCSTANLGPGYDVFGLALDALEDKVKISKISPGNGRKISIRNSDLLGGLREPRSALWRLPVVATSPPLVRCRLRWPANSRWAS